MNNAEQRQYFDVQANERYQCFLQLKPPVLTESLEAALQLCLEEPACTYVAYRPSDGNTEICTGRYKELDYLSNGARDWYSAFRKGCGGVNQADVLQQMLAGEPISCSQEQECSCPAGAEMVMGCREHTEAICDACPGGYCPVLQPHIKKQFSLGAYALARLGFKQGFRAFNPTLFREGKDMFAVFRVSNHTFCGGIESGKLINVVGA